MCRYFSLPAVNGNKLIYLFWPIFFYSALLFYISHSSRSDLTKWQQTRIRESFIPNLPFLKRLVRHSIYFADYGLSNFWTKFRLVFVLSTGLQFLMWNTAQIWANLGYQCVGNKNFVLEARWWSCSFKSDLCLLLYRLNHLWRKTWRARALH